MYRDMQERAAFIIAGSCVAVAAGALVTFTSTPVQAWLLDRGNLPRAAEPYEPARDPAVGSTVVLPRADVLGRPIPKHAKGRIVLALCGACSECSLTAVPPESVSAAKAAMIVFIYASSESEIPRPDSGSQRHSTVSWAILVAGFTSISMPYGLRGITC